MLDERLDPVGRHDYISQQHWARYAYACQHLKAGMKVLDIACGAGYGAAMMHNLGCEVTGGDYDEEVIENAKAKWPGIRFVKANALDLPFADASFDAVVSFETIEHVHEGSTFLAEIKRVLRPGGVFICSTPNIRYTSHPPYHVREYEPDEYFELIQENFSGVTVAGQYFRLSDRLRDLAKWKVMPTAAGILQALRLKAAIKVAVRAIRPRRRHGPERALSASQPLLSTTVDRTYDVRPVEPGAYGLLRIMVTVAFKS